MKEHTLQRLNDGARQYIRDNETFLRGEQSRINEDLLTDHVEELDYINRDAVSGSADLAELESDLRALCDEYDEGSPAIDGEAAAAVRKHVNLTRAQAADSGVFHDLCVRKFPWFVRHRWSFKGLAAMEKKFWTVGTPLDARSCTFERLWWIAELTREQNNDGSFDYSQTRTALDRRRFAFRVFDIQLGRHRPTVQALLKVLGDGDGGLRPNSTIDSVVEKVRRSGSATPLEGRDTEELIDAFRDIRDRVESS